MNLDFEWDEAKANTNLRKHGLSFEEVRTVFADPLAKVFPDEWQSRGERREIIIGHLPDGRLVLVVFSERQGGRIRIISARPATPKEKRDYDRHAR